MRPKIVILSAFLSPFRSGAEACAEEVPAQLKNDFDFVIITARMRKDLPPEDQLPSGIRVIRVGFGSTFDKWLYPFLAPKEAKKIKPDIIHAILETFAGYALKRCKRIVPNAKCILTLQTTNRSFLKESVVRSADKVTAISSVLVKKASEYGVKAELIPNGIPYEAIRKACETYQKVLGRILFVGRLEYMKGVDLLLDAFAKVHHSEAKLHIVGDGSLSVFLRQKAKDLHIDDRVVFKGYLRNEDLYREYAEAEIFCGLSRSEALGNVFLEAQAAGCLLIATRVGGIPEIIHEGKAGILVEVENSEAAIFALQSFLDSDSELHTDRSQYAVHYAKQYDWSLIAQKYKAIYDGFLSRTN